MSRCYLRYLAGPYNGATSTPDPATVVACNFGFVTQASSGAGPAQTTYGGYDLNRFTTGSVASKGTTGASTQLSWGTDSSSGARGPTLMPNPTSTANCRVTRLLQVPS